MASIGLRHGVLSDPPRRNWQNTGARPIEWAAWYPCVPRQQPPEQTVAFFELGDVHLDADPAPGVFPVVLLSHGTGGSAESLGWIARSLAEAGHVVIGANHHGNTSHAPYLAEGFLCWWERAADLSVLLTELPEGGPFAGRLDLTQVSAVGFSLGGYTVLALAGAITSLAVFDAWRKAQGNTEGGPREFPDAADQIPHLLETSPAFRTSWEGHGKTYSDPRVSAFVALAPAPPVRAFTEPSVAAIDRPVTLLSGGADQEAPTEDCAGWLAAQNPDFHHVSLGPHVGHYTFLELPADPSQIGSVDIFTDHPSVARAEVHQSAAGHTLRALTP